jgi:hypothetical protein
MMYHVGSNLRRKNLPGQSWQAGGERGQCDCLRLRTALWLRGFTYFLLNFPDGLLDFALHLLAGIAFDCAGNVVQFSLDLFDFPCRYIFLTHVLPFVRDEMIKRKVRASAQGTNFEVFRAVFSAAG